MLLRPADGIMDMNLQHGVGKATIGQVIVCAPPVLSNSKGKHILQQFVCCTDNGKFRNYCGHGKLLCHWPISFCFLHAKSERKSSHRFFLR